MNTIAAAERTISCILTSTCICVSKYGITVCRLSVVCRLVIQTLQVAVTALTMLFQGALLLVAAATVTALVGLPYCGGGH